MNIGSIVKVYGCNTSFGRDRSVLFNLYNNSLIPFWHCPLILGPISIGSVPFQIKTEGESFDPGLVAIVQTMEIPFKLPL